MNVTTCIEVPKLRLSEAFVSWLASKALTGDLATLAGMPVCSLILVEVLNLDGDRVWQRHEIAETRFHGFGEAAMNGIAKKKGIRPCASNP